MSYNDHPEQQWGNAQWAPPPPAGEPSSLGGLRTALTVLFVVSSLFSLLSVAAYAGRIGYVDEVIESGSIDRQRAEDADAFVAGSVILWFVVFLAIAAVFIVWQYRHAKNARVLGAQGHVTSPGWAVGGWFIPLANLIIPARNLFLNARRSDLDGQHAATGGRGPAIVVVWAVCFALAAILDRGAAAGAPDEVDADYLDRLQNADGLSLAANLGYVAAAVLAIVMVRTLTSRQEAALRARLAMIGGQAQPYGSWPAAPPGSPYGQAPYGQAPYGQAGPAQPSYGQPSYGPPPSPYEQPPAGDPYAQPSSPPSATPAGWSPQQPAQPDQSAPPSPFAQRASATPDEPAPSDPDAPQGPPAPPPVPPS
ncbi:DUF4328 domain-containing protein [Jiangella alkaliphila]|uniref:DUF4328 domain-containing protein n=1 Tax=Jiangella alkaliphila TaxID=419479 RepID=A0A1H2J9B2_9ACTN|nr:DUF4328 domain-containing protein [Jiangella alkaliphila]SDU52766.1 protein of unknown function [Jiangella alkaliphila]